MTMTYESFKCECPKCGSDDLTIVEATLCVTGERLDMRVPLSADGFEVPVASDEKECSTEDEIVRCGGCGYTFDLSDITL